MNRRRKPNHRPRITRMITDTLESIRPHLRYLRWMPASRGPLVLAAQSPSWPPIFGPGAHALVWRPGGRSRVRDAKAPAPRPVRLGQVDRASHRRRGWPRRQTPTAAWRSNRERIRSSSPALLTQSTGVNSAQGVTPTLRTARLRGLCAPGSEILLIPDQPRHRAVMLRDRERPALADPLKQLAQFRLRFESPNRS